MPLFLSLSALYEHAVFPRVISMGLHVYKAPRAARQVRTVNLL